MIAEVSAVIEEYAHQLIRVGQEHSINPQITEQTNLSHVWLNNLSFTQTSNCTIGSMVGTLSLAGLFVPYDPAQDQTVDPQVMDKLLAYIKSAKTTKVFLCHGHSFFKADLRNTVTFMSRLEAMNFKLTYYDHGFALIWNTMHRKDLEYQVIEQSQPGETDTPWMLLQINLGMAEISAPQQVSHSLFWSNTTRRARAPVQLNGKNFMRFLYTDQRRYIEYSVSTNMEMMVSWKTAIHKGILHNVDFGLHCFNICGQSLLELDADFEQQYDHTDWEQSGVMESMVDLMARSNARRNSFSEYIGAECYTNNRAQFRDNPDRNFEISEEQFRDDELAGYRMIMSVW